MQPYLLIKPWLYFMGLINNNYYYSFLVVFNRRYHCGKWDDLDCDSNFRPKFKTTNIYIVYSVWEFVNADVQMYKYKLPNKFSANLVPACKKKVL